MIAVPYGPGAVENGEGQPPPGRFFRDHRRGTPATEGRLRRPHLAQLPAVSRRPEPGQYRYLDAEHRPGLADLRADPQLSLRRPDDGAAVPADWRARPAGGPDGGPPGRT